jgi:cell wall-associated NlpC family hydrolase
MGVAVAQYALQFVGNPYVYGGTSLTNGADCSGFVMSVYANFGVSLPHSSASDRSQGYAVDSLDNAQPGDLICYSGHVALYIGNGQIVHASNKRTGIIVSNANYRTILAIRRIF